MRASQYALPTGATLLNYTLRSVLGQGGFGITYLATDNYLKRYVAIKEYMPAEFVERDQSNGSLVLSQHSQKDLFHWGLNSFYKEATIMAKFKHGSIVQVLNLFKENQTAYIVMEYERGSDLRTLVERHVAFSEQQLMTYSRAILDGLHLMHANGVLHRDIKPGNIYLRANGLPMLLDFGSARCPLPGNSAAMTCLLTQGYSPIEQYGTIADINIEGPWSDIYSLAATLYHLVCGERPCDATTRAVHILNDNPDPIKPLQGRPELAHYSPHFLHAIDRALCFKAKLRPQTAREWSAMLCGEAKTAFAARPAAAFLLGSGRDGDKCMPGGNGALLAGGGGRPRRVSEKEHAGFGGRGRGRTNRNIMERLRLQRVTAPAESYLATATRCARFMACALMLTFAIVTASFFYSADFRNGIAAYTEGRS